MDEYLNEQEQWDLVRNWLRQNGVWLVAAVALAAVGIWGYRARQAHVETEYLQAGAQYQQLLTAFGKNDLPTVISLADKLSAEHTGTGYAEHAQLAAARLQVENHQLPNALERLQKVLASTSDPALALLTRLRIARIQVDEHKSDEAIATLAGAQPGAFAGRYAEVRGDALLAKGDRRGALQAYRDAQTALTGPAPSAPSAPNADSAAAAIGATEVPEAGATSGDLLSLKINELARS